jgi:hypothetical protein
MFLLFLFKFFKNLWKEVFIQIIFWRSKTAFIETAESIFFKLSIKSKILYIF